MRKLPGRKRAAGPLTDSRGMILILAMFFSFAVGMFLFSFLLLNQREAYLSLRDRNSTMAFNLAESGILEAEQRLALFGAIPGAKAEIGEEASISTFPNSLAQGDAIPGASGTITYEATVSGFSAYFPILSKATYGGTQRAVRALVWAKEKAPIGSAVVGLSVAHLGDASPVTSDVYARSSVSFSMFRQSMVCAREATSLRLVGPQVLAGTAISAGPGPASPSPCGVTGNFFGTAYTECNPALRGSESEVAPTGCGSLANRTHDPAGHVLPVNWHPMTPIGMPAEDFNAVIGARSLPPWVRVIPATQDGTAVRYEPGGTYTPPYWTSVPSTARQIVLIKSTQPFCVNASLGLVQPPPPQMSGSCADGYNRYGDEAETAGTTGTVRYLDWGLVMDDLNRGVGEPATRFYQPPLGCPTCGGGNPNGIRYIPVLPAIDVMALACRQNVPPPGTNAFLQAHPARPPCGDPSITDLGGFLVRFAGTRTHPESLIIDNAGLAPVRITGSEVSGQRGCGTDVNTVNWGLILATGDVVLEDRFAFSGFIYTPGAVKSRGNVIVHGGIFAGSNVETAGTVSHCAASMASLPLSPLFFTFEQIAWLDRPLNER